MSWLFAKLYDRYMRQSEVEYLGSWRAELLATLEGTVLEVGAGSGANLPYYPSTVEKLIVAEPDSRMRALLERRLAASSSRLPPVELSTAALPTLPFADERFDAVVATLVLCSVPDLPAALASIARVLRPFGRLVFIEHVASDEPRVRKQQAFVEPFWKWLADGCHLTRDTESAIAKAGFTFERCERDVLRKNLSICRAGIRGIARRAA